MHIAVAQSFEVFFHNVFCGAQADIVVGREDIEAHGFQVPASLPDYPGFFEREERASKVDFRHVAIAVPLNRRYPAKSSRPKPSTKRRSTHSISQSA